MLDENLPTFFFRQSSDRPLSSILYFTQNGSEPVAEYSLRRVDPTLPQAKNRYAVALSDAAAQDVIFAEVLIEPEFQQPTLSAAEIRAQGGAPPPPVPMIPDGFNIQLYNPDQQVAVKGEKSTWTGKESWEFEIPQQSFRMPSASTIDRQQTDPSTSGLTPKIMFKWKRDSKFSKDMTCYMTGRSVGGKKSKEPDITVAMYKHAREQSVTVYEPNLQRVEVEDRKGLEVVLLLGAEVIREIYLFPSRESFNLNGAPPNKRKNSRPIPGATTSSPSNAHVMTGAMGNIAPAKTNSPITQQPSPPQDARPNPGVDAETRRLQALQEQQERERERRDRAEQKRIKKMLEEEERERNRRDAEVAQETERLRRQFGMAGQDFGPKPNLPPRPSAAAGPVHAAGPGHYYHQPQQRPTLHLQTPTSVPPRPSSAGPRPHGGGGGGHHGGISNWFRGPAVGSDGLYMPPSLPQSQGPPGRRRGGSADVGKMKKKRSVFF